ncbi:MAG: Inosine-5'-monophosphate dehydrogenase [Verrucomicrobiae bacterium]|nr:Inosine-5'-monophosphate dehydrogenase [Verrucomicrobiae bacterium]
MQSAASVKPVERAGDARKVSVAQILVYELRVRDAMSHPPITALPTDTLRSIQQLMKRHKISGVPVRADGNVLGMVSLEDIITALDEGHIDDPADKWMVHKVISLRDHYSLVRAVAEFERHGFGRFPVVDSADRLVGLITRGDITNCLMHHLERRAEEAVAHEAALVAARTVDEKAQRYVFRAAVKSGDFDHAGKISQRMRSVMRARGIDPDVRRRAAIVAYEAETNIIIHTFGGELSVVIDPDKVVIDATDLGPGIENTEQAMQEGWSTAGRLARQLGFGAGMGLPNMKKCSDVFEVKSEVGGTTHIHSEIFLKKATGPL